MRMESAVASPRSKLVIELDIAGLKMIGCWLYFGYLNSDPRSIQLAYLIGAAQKIKKLSETPVTVHNIAKLCVIDGKNREITKKLVQPVPPPPLLDPWEFQWENDQKNKMAKNHFSGVQNGSQSV